MGGPSFFFCRRRRPPPPRVGVVGWSSATNTLPSQFLPSTKPKRRRRNLTFSSLNDYRRNQPMPMTSRQRQQPQPPEENTDLGKDGGMNQSEEALSLDGPRKKSPRKKRAAKADATDPPSSSANVVSPSPIASDASGSNTVKRPRREAKSSPQANKGPPNKWQEIYGLVEELRQDRTAPCDSMGCEALATRNEGDLPGYRFQVLVALLLSSQTKDAMVSEAVQLMKKDDILSIHGLRQPNVTLDDLSEKYLGKVGFRNNKAKYLKQVVDILHKDYRNDIPPTAAQMMELPGIGPKMAYICEAVAWDPDVPSGIGVDTHMHRLFNQLGWVKAKTPEQTRIQLESWLPIQKWKTVNLLWVGFGQEVQQHKSKILKKALQCSRPAPALRLLQRCGVELKKDGTKHNLYTQIQAALEKDQQE